MLTKPDLREADSPVGVDAVESSAAGTILLGVFDTLDRAGIRYCVLHGYENYPGRIKSDVDVLICAEVAAAQLHTILQENRGSIGADVVRRSGYFIILAGRNDDSSPSFLTLDLCVDCGLDSLPFSAGAELLASRRRYRDFWVPAAHLEFGCYVARTIAKGGLDEARERRLSSLYRQDPDRCDEQVAQFWAEPSAGMIIAAARSGMWEPVRQRLGALASELRRRAILLRPRQFFAYMRSGIVGRITRVLKPQGLVVALLGCDGAGKSSLIEALEQTIVGHAFARSECRGFAPPLNPKLRRGTRSTAEPHGLAPRSGMVSVMRAAYWYAYSIASLIPLRLALARSTLVLHDRHFVDILVDAKRYRYGGPKWLLRLIWRLMPKPDLIILLDAPAEVLQSRKQEVSFEETLRQREAYLSLIRTMKNGHVVNTAQSRECVVNDVCNIILKHLSLRAASRL